MKGAVRLGLVAVMLWPEYGVLTVYAKVEADRYVY